MTANKPSDAIPAVMQRRIKELERDGYNEDFLRCFRNAIRSLDETDRYAHANTVQAKEIRDLREWLDDEIQGRRDLMEELTAVVEQLAEADKADQLLRADLAATAREEDLILVALRLDPERYRTECGYLNVPKIIAAIKNPDMYPRTAVSASACSDCNDTGIIRDTETNMGGPCPCGADSAEPRENVVL